MKLLSKSILSAVFLQLSLIPTVALTQDSHECFMQDANGNPIDLGHLCGGSQNRANTSTIRTRNRANSTDFFVVPIKRRVGGQFGTPVIDVKFNDKYVFEMLFDTGATITLITKPMAQTLKLKPTGQIMAQTASSNLVVFDTSQVRSISSGNLATRNLNIAIGDTIEMGLLGQNFYGMYEYTVKKDRIEFRKR